MPFIVAYSDTWICHWTKSTANHATMRKCFYFFILRVVILPSLGLTSAKDFSEWAINVNGTYRWERAFRPDNAAFFLNYVITSGFLGTALELLRISDLIMYAYKFSCAK